VKLKRVEFLTSDPFIDSNKFLAAVAAPFMALFNSSREVSSANIT
jgi:hypothetical protein